MAKISRITWRSVLNRVGNLELKSLQAVSNQLGLSLGLLSWPKGQESTVHSELSTVAISLYVVNDGFDSWKIHFMNFVDEFRRTLDSRLLVLPPVPSLPDQLKALLASIVFVLCEEAQIDVPPWAKKNYFLPSPWFVANIESLKASALVESPFAFRKNNIFVGSNILERI